VIRSLIDGMARQRPEHEGGDRDEMWDLDDQARTWMSRLGPLVNSLLPEARIAFIPVIPDALQPRLVGATDIQRAAYWYPLTLRHTPEIRRQVLRMVYDRVPSHAREARELRDSRCTGYCRHLDFNPDAPEGVHDLIFRMVLASLGSQTRGAARSRGIGVIGGT
jgi:hypothetical protein